MTPLTEATRGATANPMITLDPTADRRNAVVAMVVPEAMVLNVPKIPALVQGTNPHISHRRIPTPPAPPIPPVIPTPGEVTVPVVRRKVGTPPAATEQATARMEETTSHMEETSLTEEATGLMEVTKRTAPPNKAVTVEEAAVVKGTTKNVIVTSITREKLVVRSIMKENVATRRIAMTKMGPMALAG